ncbi:hypothetical protein ACEXQD_00945 [Herbiconiux sp. P15]|uniref:hypothetical protein n=1 Tax=Herbiconiux liukaitaii TaxID=3342799 RepID=UPI0035B85D19
MSDSARISPRLPPPPLVQPNGRVGLFEASYCRGDVETVPPDEEGGWMHGYVVSGELRLEVGASGWTVLCGDSLALDCGVGFRVIGVSEQPAQVVWFIVAR